MGARFAVMLMELGLGKQRIGRPFTCLILASVRRSA